MCVCVCVCVCVGGWVLTFGKKAMGDSESKSEDIICTNEKKKNKKNKKKKQAPHVESYTIHDIQISFSEGDETTFAANCFKYIYICIYILVMFCFARPMMKKKMKRKDLSSPYR